MTYFDILLLSSVYYFKINGISEFPSFYNSNDDMEEGDPGSDSDFEIDTKKEVSNRRHSGF